MDITKVQMLRESINESLSELGAAFGLQIEVTGSIKYGKTHATMTVQAAELNEEGNAETAEASDFRARASRYGLHADDLGRRFELDGYTYTVTGLKTRNRSYPILTSRNDGKIYKFAPSRISTLLRTAGVV